MMRRSALGAATVAAMLALSSAAAQVREESAEDFNRRAQAQEDAYRQQWEADRAAAVPAAEPQASAPATESATNQPSSTAQSTTPMSNEADEEAGLACLNDNRAAVQLPPLTLQDFREGRAAGVIADPATLCGADHIPPAAAESAYAVPDTAPPAATTSNNDLANALVIAFLIAAALAYFAPTYIAFKRGHEYRWIIAALNLVAGWTGVAWIWVFVWSIWPRQRALASPVFDDATGIEQGR